MAQNSHNKNIGTLARLKRAVVVSIDGLKEAWRGEEAFRQEVFVTVFAIPVAILLPVSLLMKMLLLGSLFLIMVVEILNSAIEAVVDLVTEEEHPLAKNAKDFGSAAVLICILQAGLIWSIVLFTCLKDYLSRG